MKVLVTGASGFVGGPVCRTLAARGHHVIAAARRPLPGLDVRTIADIGPDTDWSAALEGVEAVVHLAARAHIMNETAADPLTLFRRINRDGAIRLAEQAAAANVRRLVFVSSIKVNGEATPCDQPFRADDTPAPVDPYGVAKAEAEAALAAVAARTGLELAVVRPPLVHGPGAKGNLATLMAIIAKGLPLPLGAIDNRRSLVGVDNLADLLERCLTHPAAAGGTFLVRDDPDVSTAGLIRLIATAMHRPARLLPVPASWLRLAGRLTGRSAAVARLTGSLVVDDDPTRRRLDWSPSLPLAAGLAAMVAIDSAPALSRYDRHQQNRGASR
jgi:nucleoside-diphosphate-sugar epimerase